MNFFYQDRVSRSRRDLLAHIFFEFRAVRASRPTIKGTEKQIIKRPELLFDKSKFRPQTRILLVTTVKIIFTVGSRNRPPPPRGHPMRRVQQRPRTRGILLQHLQKLFILVPARTDYLKATVNQRHFSPKNSCDL